MKWFGRYRIDLQEGDDIPRDKWLAWGNIIPWRESEDVPTRCYILINLPVFQHWQSSRINTDALIYCWQQLHLLWTGMKSPKWKPLPRDGWRFVYLDTNDEPTAVLPGLSVRRNA